MTASDLICSALAHELCHMANDGLISEAQADECSAQVIIEYRKSAP